jgi:hypothetical protein
MKLEKYKRIIKNLRKKALEKGVRAPQIIILEDEPEEYEPGACYIIGLDKDKF